MRVRLTSAAPTQLFEERGAPDASRWNRAQEVTLVPVDGFVGVFGFDSGTAGSLPVITNAPQD